MVLSLAASTPASPPPAAPSRVPAPASSRAADTPQPSKAAATIQAESFFLWIYPTPSFEREAIGYLRAGSTVSLKSEEVVSRAGCSGGWLAVEPAGYVCQDRHATREDTHYSRSMKALMPQEGADFPFYYALSLGSPTYRRLPSAEEIQQHEPVPPASRQMPSFWRGREQLAHGEFPPPRPLPEFLRAGGSVARVQEDRLVRRQVPLGSTIAFTQSFKHEGRLYVQNADGTLVPAERLRAYQPTNFSGVSLAKQGLQLPFAFNRPQAASYQLALAPECALPEAESSETGQLNQRALPLKAHCLVPHSAPPAPRTPWVLSGRLIETSQQKFVEARRLGETEFKSFLPLSQIYLAERRRPPSKKSGKWISYSIRQGTLVLYENDTPLYVTLASPGSGGSPRAGGDSLRDRTTPLGHFRIQFKHWTDDMSPEFGEHRSGFFSEVPFALYFQAPFAIHVAYWHENFGEPMSGGCINVSPRDGAHLFHWTDPPLPPGWHGVGASRALGWGTEILIER